MFTEFCWDCSKSKISTGNRCIFLEIQNEVWFFLPKRVESEPYLMIVSIADLHAEETLRNLRGEAAVHGGAHETLLLHASGVPRPAERARRPRSLRCESVD